MISMDQKTNVIKQYYLTDPASKKANPGCMKNTKHPMVI